MIRIILTVLAYCFVGWLLCDIDPDKYYTWYSGIWHGLFLYQTCCVAGWVMPYIKRMTTARGTIYGGGFLPYGAV